MYIGGFWILKKQEKKRKSLIVLREVVSQEC